MPMVRYVLDPNNPPRPTPEERAALEAMTDEEILAAALADPDAQPATEAQLAHMAETHAIRRARKATGLSQAAFAERYGIPLASLRDWEQGRTRPTPAARSYLRVIERAPGMVASVLAAE